ncbi:MAG: SMC-Scp complex subunit ScpB [Parachlamydiales bacterium]|nr:SMC-Scp complex subunit ScpB [Parachlamydiales bacterium]
MNDNSSISAPYFQVKRILEALFFACTDPIPLNKLQELIQDEFEITPKEIRNLLQELKEEYRYSHRAFDLVENDSGWTLRSKEEYRPHIEKLFEAKRQEKLSMASTEVLTIIAYRQPMTRPAIEALRGVDCSAILQSLMEKGLIEVIGKQESAGRPSLYAVTQRFLDHFGISSTEELPKYAEKIQ